MTRRQFAVAATVAFLVACHTEQDRDPAPQMNSVTGTAVSQPANPALPILPPRPEPAPDPAVKQPRAELLAALQKEYDDAVQAYRAAFKDAKTAEDRKAISETVKPLDAKPFRLRARALVDEDPKDEVALDAITWMITGGRTGSDQDELLAIVEAHHMKSEKLVELCDTLANSRSGRGPALVERAITENPHAAVRGTACFSLAQVGLRDVNSARRAQALKDADEIERWKERVGTERAAHLLALDASAKEKHAEELLVRVVNEFPDVPGYKRTLGEQAHDTLFELRHLAVGMVAPEIEGEDLAGMPFKLSDYRGKVVMLDYWGNW